MDNDLIKNVGFNMHELYTKQYKWPRLPLKFGVTVNLHPDHDAKGVKV